MRSAVFGPDGSKILTAGEDRSLRVWNAATGELVFSIDDHPSVPTIATFREDGATILSVSEKGGAFIWDGATGAPLHKIRKRVPQTEVLSQPLPVSAKPSLLDHRGSRLVQPLADASFVVWDLDASKELLRHRREARSLEVVDLSPDGRWVLVRSTSAHSPSTDRAR